MWNRLKTADKPIVLYGTGNAAEKIIAELNKRDITIAGIFASDGFVRSRSFCGYPVLSFSEAKEKFGDMIVLLCFGSHLDDVINNIKRIASETELYAPDLPIAGDGLFCDSYTLDSKEVLDTKEILADEKSKEVLLEVVKYKLDGKIEHLISAETDDRANWELLSLNDNESYLDLGAYTGDTVKQFLDLTGNKYSYITALEPEKRNFRKLLESSGNLDNTELINMAIGCEKSICKFLKNQGRGGKITSTNKPTYEIEQTTIDELSKKRSFSFIKMDLEGSEQDAILGASETIKNDRPKMLVSAYHRNDDLFVIPKLVLSFNPSYRVYLRKSPCLPAWEVNYYFV